MKLKGIRSLLCLLICLLLVSTPAYAQGEEESIRDFAQTDRILQAAPEPLDRDALSQAISNGDVSGVFGEIGTALLSLVSLEGKQALSFFAGLCIILLLGAMTEAVRSSFTGTKIETALDLIFLLVLSLYAFRALESSFSLTKNALGQANAFMLAVLPVTTLLLSLSGSIGSANLLYANLSLVVSFVSSFVSTTLFPMLKGLFALTLVDGFSDVDLNSLLAFLKKSVKVICVLLFTLLSALLSMQNALAVAKDSLAMRGVRFAAGNFIPVVGSLVGEASRTLSASLKLVRSECGILCVAVILFVILQPILTIGLKKLSLRFAAAVAKILNVKRCALFLEQIGSLLDLMGALLISHGVYLVFYITLFLQNKGSLG